MTRVPGLLVFKMDIFAWYFEIPIVSRMYMTAAIICSTACYMDLLSPLTMYYNFDLVLYKGQYWRLISSFIFFGSFSIDFLFHLYFVVRYCRLLEEGHFRGRTADFVWMIIIGIFLHLVFAVSVDAFSRIRFLGHSLSFMMVYCWGRDPLNGDMQMNLLGLFPFHAPYLAWVLLIFSMVMGNPIETDLLGIVVGHIYYFFDVVYPHISLKRGWTTRYTRVVTAPAALQYLFNERPQAPQAAGVAIQQ